MKIIFLDIDGVLNYQFSEARIHGCLGIEPSRVHILKQIVNQTDAKIVLTSTWKMDWDKDETNLNSWGQYMVSQFKDFGLTIYDKTSDDGMNRGQGILNWLKGKNIESFVIIDDELFDYNKLNLIQYVVKTSFYKVNGGIQISDIQKAVNILTKVS